MLAATPGTHVSTRVTVTAAMMCVFALLVGPSHAAYECTTTVMCDYSGCSDRQCSDASAAAGHCSLNGMWDYDCGAGSEGCYWGNGAQAQSGGYGTCPDPPGGAITSTTPAPTAGGAITSTTPSPSGGDAMDIHNITESAGAGSGEGSGAGSTPSPDAAQTETPSTKDESSTGTIFIVVGAVAAVTFVILVALLFKRLRGVKKTAPDTSEGMLESGTTVTTPQDLKGASAQQLVARLEEAATRAGFEMKESSGRQPMTQTAGGKYDDAGKMVLGLPPDAALGIVPFLNVEGGESAFHHLIARGLDGMKEEIELWGTDVDKECRDYVLYAEAGSSDKAFQNGWIRDRDPVTGEVCKSRLISDPAAPGGKRGKMLRDFVDDDIAKLCQLTEAEVFAARFYSTWGYQSINFPLRDPERRSKKEPHRLAATVYHLNSAIKKLRAWTTTAPNAHTSFDLFRGMGDRSVMEDFMCQGGTEFAPMSTTAELDIALKYSQGKSGHAVLLWLHSKNFMDRGVDLKWLSAFPHEAEYLSPPLSYLKPTREEPTVVTIGAVVYQVVEVEIQMS